jgi:hypothetical protein
MDEEKRFETERVGVHRLNETQHIIFYHSTNEDVLIESNQVHKSSHAVGGVGLKATRMFVWSADALPLQDVTTAKFHAGAVG